MDELPPPPTDPDDPEELENWALPREWEPPEHPDFLKHWELPDDWTPMDPEDCEPDETDWDYSLQRTIFVSHPWDYKEGPEEFLPPEEWISFQEPEPPEDWEVLPPWELADGHWEPAEDWEAPEDWAEIGSGYRDLSSCPLLLYSQLTKCEPCDFRVYYPPPPGSPLSAPDWAVRWIPYLSAGVSHDVRLANISTLFREVTTSPDARELAQLETALSWMPILEARGYYSPRDPKTGTIDFDTRHSARAVYFSSRQRLTGYREKSRKFLARGKPLVEDIIHCFDGICLVEKTWRSISLREGMGIPTQVPACLNATLRVKETKYYFGEDPPVDPDVFHAQVKALAREMRSCKLYVRRGESWIEDT